MSIGGLERSTVFAGVWGVVIVVSVGVLALQRHFSTTAGRYGV
jgi:hypothetical protein